MSLCLRTWERVYPLTPVQRPSAGVRYQMMLLAGIASPLLEIALVLVRFNHIASVIVNANNSTM